MMTMFRLPMALFLLAAAAFSQPPPKFEVASIKPNTSADHNSTWRSGTDRFTGENIPIRFLIMTAFRIKESQLAGLPGWTGIAKYDIEAKAEGTPSQEQIYGMLQSLLAERFQLKYHRAKKTMSVFALVPAKGGIKVELSKEGPCPLPPPNYCGQWFSGSNHADGTRLMMPQLADALTFNLDRIVVDKTGFKKTFDVKLTWSAEPDPADKTDVSEGPSIFTAVQEQLGLRLEAAKAPVDVLVVDHLERPSEN
jgi:uncharacterized protein (TIGR03435 family)